MTIKVKKEDYDKKEEIIRQYELVMAWVKTATIKDMVNVIADAHHPKGNEDVESEQKYPYAFTRAKDALERLIDVVSGDEEDQPDGY